MKDYCKELETPDGLISVQGYYDSRFERVMEEFSQNFYSRGEVGAGVSVTLDGETVVDLWGGVADAKSKAMG